MARQGDRRPLAAIQHHGAGVRGFAPGSPLRSRAQEARSWALVGVLDGTPMVRALSSLSPRGKPMPLLLCRPSAAVTTLALLASFAHAQNAPRAAVSQQGNSQLSLPYGAKDDRPVSRWTPSASAGRQLTLNDLVTWKSIRTPQLSNDGKSFAYVLAPNEGDAEVVIRGTAAGAKEMRFSIGELPAPQPGPAGAAAAAPALTVSGNGRWAAFLIYPTAASNAARRNRGGGAGGGGGGAGGSTAPATPTKLGIVNLADGSKREIENVRAFRFAGDKSDWIAVHHSAPASASSAGGAP